MSDKKYDGNFFDYFITIYDPRQDEKVKHKLIDVVFINWVSPEKECVVGLCGLIRASIG